MIKLENIKPSTKIECALSNRSINVIKKANKLLNDKKREIKTIKDLGKFSELEILSLKGCGASSSKEMLDAIERVGLQPSVKSNRLNHISWRHVFLNKPEIVKKNLKHIIAI